MVVNRTTVNDTSGFYEGESPSLFWEMTICQSLADASSSAARALEYPRAYGEILGGFLDSRLTPGAVPRVLEIGGGMGTLMGNLRTALAIHDPTMVDISPRFSGMQRERLRGRGKFVVSDVFLWLDATKDVFDLAIANENMGDLPTVVVPFVGDLHDMVRRGPPFDATPLGRTARLVHGHHLPLPDGGTVAVNVGALELVEKLAGRAGMVFLSEHSASVRSAPPYDFLIPLADGAPRRIALKDHDEYSINFDHLEQVAGDVGFKVERIWMPEFLGVRSDAGARFMAGAECAGNEVAEAVHEFLHHVKEYECALLTAI